MKIASQNISRGQSPRFEGLPIVLAVFAFALFAGMAIGFGLGAYAVGGVLATVGMLVWTQVGWRSYAPGRAGLFWWAFVLTFITALATLFSPVRLTGIMEIWLLGVAALALPMLPWWLRQSIFARWFFVLFGVFVVFSILSSVFGYSKPFAALYQFLYNLKFPLMLLLGFRIGWSVETDRRFWRVLTWFWAPLSAFVILELAAPSLYHSLALGLTEGGSHSVTPNPLLRGVLDRVTGPFQHSGVLAYFAALFALLMVVRILTQPQLCSWRTWLAGAAYLGLLVLSGQRQEAAAWLVCAVIVFFVVRVRFSSRAILASVAVAMVALFTVLVVLGEEQIETLSSQWGMGDSYTPIKAARTVFYRDSIAIANDHFPLGSGLGTYGGVGAQQYDHSQYEQLGYGRYWWYRLNLYLVDTYWPNFIAEVGWLGATALLLAVLGLMFYALVRAWQARPGWVKQLWTMAFVSQFLSVTVSTTSPLYSDPNFVALAMMFFGIAMRHSAEGATEPDRELR